MLKLVKTSTAVAALLGAVLITPAMAQDASEMVVRMQQLEEQVRQLTGQVQRLSFEVQQLRAGKTEKTGAVQQLAPESEATQQKRLAAASAGEPLPESEGVEVVDQQPAVAAAPQPEQAPDVQQAPKTQVLGALGTAAAKPNDGGFQGKVLVPPSQQEPGDDAFLQVAPVEEPADSAQDSIETVSLAPESPEALYEQSNESLLRRQFADAEAGFSNFLQKFPDHSLAGSAQYWLGETYYAQGDFKRAAQSFLMGYKKYPNSRRAADSLLKLGLSLGRLGQAEQACAAYQTVSSEYPKAVDARKRAQAEFKRAGCQS